MSSGTSHTARTRETPTPEGTGRRRISRRPSVSLRSRGLEGNRSHLRWAYIVRAPGRLVDEDVLFTKAVDPKSYQSMFDGWIADYPSAGNFFPLLHKCAAPN